MPRLSLKGSVEAPESNVLGMKTASGPKEVSNRILSDKEEVRQAIVRLLFSDSVAKGHLMIAQCLRLYLRTDLHSWVYLRKYKTALKEDIAILSLSPCYLKMLEQDDLLAKGSLELPNNIKTQKPRNTPSVAGSGTFMDAADGSAHGKFVAALSSDCPVKGDEETINHSDNKKGLARLLSTWFLIQLDVIAAIAGVEVISLILGTETLVHVEVKGHEFGKNSGGKPQALSNTNGSPEKRNKAGKGPLEFLFLLTVSEQSPHKGKNDAYKLDFDDHKIDNLWGKELLGKLKWGDPVYIYYPKERTKGFSSNVSSLSWMGTTAEDVINSRYPFFEITCISKFVVSR
uniref:Peroxisome biogenesis factor n=1 Tax=Rhizophora mucronata TaxID=61149 RepID=A0A2P2MK88_RHIMU